MAKYTSVIQTLTATGALNKIQSDFHKGETVESKVQIIEQLRKNDVLCLPDIQMRKPKSNDESTKYRNMGNQHFARNTNADYLKALEFYNKSICFAETDSEEFSLALGNRSAVYFQLKLYDDCLDNIRKAKEAGYPTRSMNKLDNRRIQCLKLCTKKVTKESPADVKLSFPSNPKIPLVANCLRLEKNDQYGRHVITTMDLKAGDVVAVEEPFCTTLLNEYKYTRCENCLNECNQNLIPCKHCTAAMFCGTSCYDEAYTNFHKFECPVIDYMTSMLSDDMMNTLRTVVSGVTTFSSVDELVSFVKESEGQDITVFDCNYNDKGSKAFGPVHFLSEKKFKGFEELTVYVVAFLIYEPLLQHTAINKMFTTVQDMGVFKKLVLHTIKTMSINRSGLVMIDGDLLKELARGVYPLRSMLSHSCAPNLCISSSGTKMIFTITRPTKAGQQLFDNYDVHFMCDSLVERQTKFKNFTCKCVACENNYPLFEELPVPNIPGLNIEAMSKKSFKVFAAYFNKYAEFYPCKQLIFAEGEFQYFLAYIYQKEMSMNMRYLHSSVKLLSESKDLQSTYQDSLKINHLGEVHKSSADALQGKLEQLVKAVYNPRK